MKKKSDFLGIYLKRTNDENLITAKRNFMENIFGSNYADAYDRLYQEKDYTAECDLLEELFGRWGNRPVQRILDLGCGTGNHALILATRGYEVVGIDQSDAMLDKLRRKVNSLPTGTRLAFQCGDVCSVNLHEHFDAALMMFAVLGYQHENERVLSALKTARHHLRSEGLLIFDVWFGPAVLRQRPSERLKVISTPAGKILRVASGKLDILHHTCTVNYQMWRFEGERLVDETEEIHRMRYFFSMELKLFLENSGFSLIRLGAFPDFERDPDESSWTVLGIARAV